MAGKKKSGRKTTTGKSRSLKSAIGKKSAKRSTKKTPGRRKK